MSAHNEYRKKWVEAGYDKRMGSAWVCLPPPADHIRLYHFTTAEHAMSNIKLGRVKVARFADSNDPFELLALNFRAERERKIGRSFKAEVNDRTGFISFSRNWTEPLMWSHYSDRHKGICLGFTLPRKDIVDIQYNDSRLRRELDERGDDPTKLSTELQELLLCTEAKGWAYEHEVRRFVPLNDTVLENSRHFHMFSNRFQLHEVVVGQRCRVKLAEIRKLVGTHQPQAIAYSARLAFRSFRIVPIETTIP